jgi:Heterokaryon incompatibility protein (HET)
VQLMRDIYVKATRTIVFLGNDTLGTYWNLPILKEITWGQTWETDKERQAGIETKTKFKQRLATTDGVKGMLSEGFYGDIATRPFWTRIWIVQEVVLSRNPIIMFGDHEVPWDGFADSSSILDTVVQDMFPEISTEAHGLANMKAIQIIREIYKLGFQVSICDLLACLRGTRSTDPRDMVYGLLGLVKAPIIADYNTSTTKTVYVSVVEHSISEDRSLDVITMRRAPSSLNGLPSWAPNWSASAICDFSQEGDLIDGLNRMPEPLVLRYVDGDLMRMCLNVDEIPIASLDEGTILDIKPFNTSAGRKLSTNEVVVNRDLMTLQVDGILVGTIYDIGSVLNREEASGEIFFHQVFRDWGEVFRRQYGNCQIEVCGLVVTIADALSRFYNFLTTYLAEIGVDFSSETWKVEHFQKYKDSRTESGPTTRNFRETRPVEAFVRTLFADRDSDFQRISSGHFEEFWTNPLVNKSRWPREVYSMTFATHRRFFVTCDGNMGLAPMRARKNDIVCVLYGCSVPIVLREEETGGFTFVGECFLHGFMDGEAIGMQKKYNLKEQKWIIY